MTYAAAVLLGVVAGVLAGLFGVGGGILFVPTLVALGLTQVHAEATSLLAIIPTVLVGVPATAGALAGTSLQQRLPVHTLSYLFAALLVAIAIRMLV